MASDCPPTGKETESWPPFLESFPPPSLDIMRHHTSEVRMFSSSRLNINGFSLGCWGSDLCLIRELGNTPAVLLSPSRGVNNESSGVSSAGSSFCPAWGTGVQGCQEEATEGALQRAFFSSTGGRPLHKTELGPPERLELPERVKEMDLEKDISYKIKGKKKTKESKGFPDNVYPKAPRKSILPGSLPHRSRNTCPQKSNTSNITHFRCVKFCLTGHIRNSVSLSNSTSPPPTTKIKNLYPKESKKKTNKIFWGFRCDQAACLHHQIKPAPSRTIITQLTVTVQQEGSDLLWGGI